MNVAEAIGLKVFEGARVVAGQQGLERRIKRVTVMEAPDIVQWLRGGELLLTSLYPIRGDLEAQEKLVCELYDRQAAALVIKTRRFVGDIPGHMVKVADELGLPIIELPMEVGYVDVISAILTEIVSQQTIKLRYSEKVHKYFTDIALKGGTLEQLASGLAELVNNPVAIKDRREEILARTCHEYQVAFENGFEIERQSLNDELHYYRQPLCLSGKDEEIKCTEVVVPISIQDEICGYLLVWEVNRLLGEHDYIALEHAATVVALELAKRMAVEEVERKFQNDFIEDLLAGKIENKETVDNRARFLGWDVTFPMVVIVANIDLFEEFVLKNKHKGERFAQNIKTLFFDTITRCLRSQNRQAIVGGKSDTVIALYPVKTGDIDKALEET